VRATGAYVRGGRERDGHRSEKDRDRGSEKERRKVEGQRSRVSEAWVNRYICRDRVI